MKSTVIQQVPLRLITVKAQSFPEGIRAAWQEIELKRAIKGRKAYGLICTTEAGMEYCAGLVSDGELEERVTGLPVVEVPGGPCARIKLENWKSKLDEIGGLFVQMAAEHEVDSSRPAMEFYRGFAELHLLLPVKDETGDLGNRFAHRVRPTVCKR
ncbi:MAG: hypothetical protein K9N47_04730 [Prosthecobacter sp.]|uniref:hypothetical protein n=1 Tax=Prosthecobacter sp. TaxID=1965333 RepID=UPI0025F682B8|nr:hypothetical protein [Prosthecobacter sp.]MCF7785403.1 hypothetical protein [Prosthecobacter sp.]